jgi:hypothetical protein
MRASLTATLDAGLYYLVVDGYPDVFPCGDYRLDLSGI